LPEPEVGRPNHDQQREDYVRGRKRPSKYRSVAADQMSPLLVGRKIATHPEEVSIALMARSRNVEWLFY
jgi:hypothetical protein